MLLRPHAVLAVAITLVSTACLVNPDGCPRGGLDSARRCKRLCVLSPAKNERPLPCICSDECLCWEMSGHPSRPVPPDAEYLPER